VYSTLVKNDSIVSLQKDRIKTKYVFIKNNQVYLKTDRENVLKSKITDNEVEWFPINFQWIAAETFNNLL
jgi:hypothetical protein